jgi:hypothetical protein
MFKPAVTKEYTLKSYSYGGRYGTDRAYTISVVASGGGGGGGGITLPQPNKSWTFLVYLDGDNNLSSYADFNINQMKQVGSDSNINIVLLWDSTNSTHGYYYVQSGANTQLQDIGEVNMGASGTAKAFVDYAKNNFPADKYAFVYWNHGGAVDRSYSANRGVAWDDTNNGDHLTEVEQKEIGDYAVSVFGKKIEMVGFDACLMATAEIYYQYRNIANYMAASEQTEPGNGWDYTALQTIKSNPSATGADLAKSVCSKYATQTNPSTNDWTISATNLYYAGNLGTAVHDFATAAIASGSNYTATFKSLAAGLSSFTGYTKDLVGYMNAILGSSLPQSVKDNATALKNVIVNDLVIQNQCGSVWNNKAYGCSMTLKSDTTTYSLLDVCVDTQWDEFCTFAGFPNS